jgi:hypothetical protein
MSVNRPRHDQPLPSVGMGHLAMRRSWWFWKSIVVAFLVAATWLGWRACHFVAYGIDNAYAQWGAAEMVIDYMETNEGR